MEVDSQPRVFDKPNLRDFSKVPSEMVVQVAFYVNILSEINYFRFLGDMFNGPGAADELVGKPDFVRIDSQGKQLFMALEM